MFKLSMPRLPITTSQVLFDISRLFRNRKHSFATGVDKIDLAIGLNLLSEFGTRCQFIHAGTLGTILLPQETGAELLRHLDSNWNRGARRNLPSALVREPLLKSLFNGGGRRFVTGDTTYVVASHSGLGKVKGALRRLDPSQSMRRLLYLHDIIPLEMPEYQRPETRSIFERFLGEVTKPRVTIVSNSADTDRRVRRLAAARGWVVEDFSIGMPILEPVDRPTPAPRKAVADYLSDPRPYFAIVGTIEPRKNHLLLLNIWRDLAMQGMDNIRLCIIGRRGWENENVLDMLERCDMIRGTVQEFAGLDDHEVQTLIEKSAALLFPSFIEGLGIPLLEAMALGIPCIVSDIPVFREIATPETVFLDPIDGPGWKKAILASIQDADPNRQAH